MAERFMHRGGGCNGGDCSSALYQDCYDGNCGPRGGCDNSGCGNYSYSMNDRMDSYYSGRPYGSFGSMSRLGGFGMPYGGLGGFGGLGGYGGAGIGSMLGYMLMGGMRGGYGRGMLGGVFGGMLGGLIGRLIQQRFGRGGCDSGGCDY